MFLMPEGGMDKINRNFLKLDTTPSKKQFKTDDFFNRINLNPEFDLSFNIDMNDSKFLSSTTRNNTKPSDLLFQNTSGLLATPKTPRQPNLNNSSFQMSPPKSSRMTSPSRIPVLNRSKNSLNVSIPNEEAKNNDSLEYATENLKNLKVISFIFL